METIEDIVREMRKMERRTVGGIVPVNPRRLADRIEAAMKDQFRGATKTMPHFREVTKKEVKGE